MTSRTVMPTDLPTVMHLPTAPHATIWPEPAAICNHVPDEATLLVADVAHETERFRAELEEALAALTDPVEQLRTYISRRLQARGPTTRWPGFPPQCPPPCSRSCATASHASAHTTEAFILRAVCAPRAGPWEPVPGEPVPEKQPRGTPPSDRPAGRSSTAPTWRACGAPARGRAPGRECGRRGSPR
jgi:hypothetical protein